ncbi:MAG TPA: M13 family metallopeptidase N-terminal domain-containing protein, partial [Dokdonella sp.]|nr:M13 family metallopeptidase N-terminal domain-containing protein [Dokdonella sp.]
MKTSPFKPLAIALGIAAALAACSQKPAEPQAGADATPAAAPAEAPKHVAFDTGEIDTNINACNDFNGFVNGKWLAANPIPADKTRWSTFDLLREASLKTQHEIVEDAAKSNAAPGTIEQKIGALYSAGMNEAVIDQLGHDP